MAMRSSALARAAGVSTDTLRYYERRGLLARPPRNASGYRCYPPEALHRVVVIQRALDAGFTLAELTRVLRQRDAGGVPCREVLAIASARLRDLDERIAGLIDLRDRLSTVVSSWRRTLDRTPAGVRARLLDTLAAAPSGANLRQRDADFSKSRAARGVRSRVNRPSG
jgi:MerR family transcriptional regulator, mercuric resistance operon regulatory protein